MNNHRPLGVQLSRMLKERGVDVVFGIPGVHNQELYRGLDASGIRHVLARHEQGAGFMADGYARATGKPGVCYVISGPGVTNILTPMGQAYSDRVPMLVIASCLDETAAWQGQLHQMKDQRLAADCVCEWSEYAPHAQAAYGLIERAFAEFQMGRNRPVCIHVPMSVLAAPAPPPPVLAGNAMRATALDDRIAALVHEEIAHAQRPLFVFGRDVATEARPRHPARLVEATGALAYMTFAGRGVLAPQHPQSLGSFLERPEGIEIFAKADLLVLFGAELGEIELRRDQPGQRCKTICIDRDAVSFVGSKEETTQAIQAEPSAMIEAVLARWDGPTTRGWADFDVFKARGRWRAQIDADLPGVVETCDAVRAAVPEHTMIYSDMTQLAYAAKELWEPALSGHWHHPIGFGTLGYALPAAIGGAVTRPGEPTLVIAGDYGLHYTLPELATAVELGLSLPIILWDNGKLGEIENSMVHAQITPQAVVTHNPDFLALARAYGACAEEPKGKGALAQALDKAFATPLPTVIRLTPQSI